MAQISANLITQEALRLIDEEGLENFSMRRLGRALEVDAKAVYYYFPSKERLLNAVLEHAFAELVLPEDDRLAWQGRLRTVAKTYYRFLLEHQNLIPLLLTIDGTVPAALQLVEQMLLALHPAGLSPNYQALIIDLFWSFLPSIALEMPPDKGDESERLQQLRTASSARFPATHRLLTELKESEADEDVDLQIDILIWGIEALRSRESE